MNKIEDQLKEIREITYKNKETSDRLEANWEHDRKDFNEFQNRLGHLETEFKTLREQLQKIPEKTQERVSEVVQPMIDTTNNLTEAVDKKRTISLKAKSFWGFLRKS